MKPARDGLYGLKSAGILWLILTLSPMLVSGCFSQKPGGAIKIWATGDSLKVRPRSSYQSSNHHWEADSSLVSLKGAGNEWVAFQLVVRAEKPLREVTVTVGDLINGNGDRIDRNNIRLYLEHFITVTAPTDRNGSTGRGEYPDPLLPFFDPYQPGRPPLASPFSLDQNRNAVVWADIYIPPETPPGDYRGRITVTAGEEYRTELNLNCRVWNFRLPETPRLLVFFDLYAYRWSKGEGLPFTLNEETWEVLRWYEIMAHDHGFSNGHWGLMPDGIGSTGGIDWSAYDRFLGQVLDGTLFRDRTPPACWELPFPENWDPGDDILADYCREVVRHWDEKGWDLTTAFVYVWDEKGPWNEKVKNYGEIIEEASGGRLHYFYTAGPHPNLYGVVDWWAPRASEYNPVLVKDRQRRGEKGFFYHAGEPSVGLMCLDAIGLAFRTWAWMAWKYGADGYFDWASNFWGKSPYTDPASFDTDNANMYLFYPGRQLDRIGLRPIKGPVSSFRMKMVRRGIQDYEYFRMADDLGLNPDGVVDSIVRRGLGVTGSYGIDPAAWSRDPKDWYRARDRLGKMIDEAVAN